jgi:HEAT repeat protein
MTKQVLGGGGLALVVALAASSAAAQGKKPDGKPVPAALKVDAKEAGDALKSSDAARIESTLATIRVAGKDGGGKQFVPAIVARLKAGLPRELVKKALDTLSDLEDPAGSEAGEMYLAHRDPDVRAAAVRCLGGSKGPSATKALRRALSDPDGRIHALAATLLGNVKANETIPDLIVALDKGVNEAAVSIGMLCDPKTSCDALLDRLKTKPFDVISSGLHQELARKDVPDDVKKKVITAVRELASQKAREFLIEVKNAWPKDGSKPVLEALEKAIKDLEGAAK